MSGRSRKTPTGVAPAKANLPSKDCAACGRPFSWRRKWARDWENVKFCSDKCRRIGSA